MPFLIEERSKGREARPSGQIRTGIKLPTKVARENVQAMEIYQRGIAAHERFDTIEANMKKHLPEGKMALAPNNPPFFYVNRENFHNPRAADEIIDKYGEVRDPKLGKQVYEFPIVPYSEIPTKTISFQYKAFKALDGKSYFSAYEGETLMCMTYPDVEKDDKAKRQRRTSRPPVPVRPCDADNCPHFGAKKCKQNIEFRFHIPGTTSGLVSLSTSSEYAGREFFLQVSDIAESIGYIPMLYRGEPIFFLRKVLRNTRYVNDEGVMVEGQQWTPILHCAIDMGLLKAMAQDKRHGNIMGNLPAPSPTASALLESPAPGIIVERVGNFHLRTQRNEVDQATGEILPAEKTPPQQAPQPQAKAGNDGNQRPPIDVATASAGDEVPDIDGMRQTLMRKLHGINKNRSFALAFSEFAATRYGGGASWGTDPAKLKRALAEVDVYAKVAPLDLSVEQYAEYADARFSIGWWDRPLDPVFSEIETGLRSGEGVYASMVRNAINAKDD